MNNNFSYIYELKGEADIYSINEGSHEEEGIIFRIQNTDYYQKYGEIRGIISIKDESQGDVDVNFIFRKESKLMFIITAFNNYKITVVNFFNAHLTGKLRAFVPIISRERDFICKEFKTVSASIFKNGEIVDTSDVGIDICEDNSKFELLDAVLYLNSKNIIFYYYRNALMFSPDTNEVDMEFVFRKFEKTMLKLDSHARSQHY